MVEIGKGLVASLLLLLSLSTGKTGAGLDRLQEVPDRSIGVVRPGETLAQVHCVDEAPWCLCTVQKESPEPCMFWLI